MGHTIQVKLMGVRGTTPAHGPDFARFGGATSCIFLRAGEEMLVLDAGTGLQSSAFRAFFPGNRFTMLITHPHADHLMGFPAFAPLFDPAVRCDVYLKTREGRGARAQIECLMAPPLWPVRTDSMKADLRFHDVPAAFSVGPVAVEAMESRHPGGSTIYKFRCGGVSVVYATDYEPESDAPEDFLAFAKGCTLLLLDAQYTPEEYAYTRGFGHSTIQRSAAIARRCGAAQTLFIHHDPKRTDRQLLALEAAVRAQHPNVRFGRGGEEVLL